MNPSPTGPSSASPAAPAVPAASSRRRQAAMPFIMLTVLIDMVAVGLIIPVLPHLVGSFTQSATDKTLWFGVVAFSFGIANFFGSPILGALSDRFGRRPVLLLGFSGLALSFFGTALANALWVLVVVRLFGGAMQSNAAVAHAYVADISAPDERARRFGLIGAMFGLGFIIGPALGGVLGAVDLQLPFWVAGVLALVNWLYGALVLPESLPLEKRRPFDWKRANPVASLAGLARLHGVGWLVAVIGLSGLAQFTLHMTWVLYVDQKFGWGPRETGWSLFAVGLMSALVQGVLLGRLLKRFPPRRLAVAGLLSSTLAYLAWGLANEGWMMYAVIFANVLGFAGASAIQSIVSNAADERTQGQAMGAVAGLNSLMAVIAPIVGPALLALVSHLPRGDWRIGAPYYFCAALQALAAVLAIHHFRTHRAPPATAAPDHA